MTMVHSSQERDEDKVRRHMLRMMRSRKVASVIVWGMLGLLIILVYLCNFVMAAVTVFPISICVVWVMDESYAIQLLNEHLQLCREYRGLIEALDTAGVIWKIHEAKGTCRECGHEGSVEVWWEGKQRYRSPHDNDVITIPVCRYLGEYCPICGTCRTSHEHLRDVLDSIMDERHLTIRDLRERSRAYGRKLEGLRQELEHVISARDKVDAEILLREPVGYRLSAMCDVAPCDAAQLAIGVEDGPGQVKIG